MKKLFFALMMLLCCVKVFAQAYDSIATAYVTTTISQNVVFNSTMQAGGTFTFSVLAHNGGGRAGQSDTANVKIQFYTSSGSLVTSVNSSYNANLPNPNAVCGNPCIDTSVPWTTVTTSATLTSTQAASVAYAKVSMYGIDGSYWAGDYGPWYRAPTLQLNGSGNLLYNPEFGPYNGVTAQGWTSSPGFGACQGAWGGSNACIVNSDGVPGTSTTGLVANQNGGGPSSTGGTTSGQAGGYNSTMSVTNAGTGATAGSPPAPTLVSTTTTNTTSTIIVGNQQQTITTPVTTKTYSDGTHTTTNGTSTTTTVSNTAFTGVHFGAAQVADVQWDVYACTQTSTCNIYSTMPGGTYNKGSWTPIGSNQYITFIPNTASDSATNPWRMILVNSDGTFTDLGSCTITVQGTDSAGNIYLFVTNDNWNGTLLSGNLGLTGQGMTFTGTANPSMSDTNSLAGNMSPTPLAPGQSGGGAAPTITSSTTTNSVSSSSNVGATTTTTNTYNWNGTTYTITGTGTPTTITTVTTPVTTNTWSDGSTTTTNGSSTTTNSTTWNYTVTGPTNAPTSPYVGTNVNGVYITQVNAGSSNNTTADQSGHGNYMNITLGGSNNTTNVGQGYTFNTIGTASESATASNYNVLGYNTSGNTNTLVSSQLGLSNSVIISSSGNNNTSTITQSGNNNQMYSLINGNGNALSSSQTGNSNIASTSLYGNNNVASISQTGSNHGVVITLVNAGGANNASVVQTGTGDAYSLQQTCTNSAGCSVSVIRNK